jgi:hypothetical protein
MQVNKDTRKGGCEMEETVRCVEPASGPAPSSPSTEPRTEKGASHMDIARAGGKAPQFEGNAYFQGAFKKVGLADYAGRWTCICFYPGDFTFV